MTALARGEIHVCARVNAISADIRDVDDDLDRLEPYSLAFTAASLRPDLVRVVAQAYLDFNDWQEARDRILASNALRARKPRSGVRMEREIRQRLQTLTPMQIERAARGSVNDRRAMAWLSVLRLYPFVRSFAAGKLRAKMATQDPVLRPSDYDDFVATEAVAHPKLTALTACTQDKMRRVLTRMLREAGILGEGWEDYDLRRAVLTHDALKTIVADDRAWLAGFLVTDAEIQTLGGNGNGRRK